MAETPNTVNTKLPCKVDVFNGVTVDLQLLPPSERDPTLFEANLLRSLEEWRVAGRRGIWLRIPIDSSELIPIATKKAGFVFHHAQADYVMLTCWLPDASVDPNLLPGYANHYIGVGGAVIDIEHGEILLINERYHVHAPPTVACPTDTAPTARVPFWKLPGGSLDTGEEIYAAAEREVFEETGVRATFRELLTFRHIHNFNFTRGDFYFVCILDVVSKDITIDPNEIEECRWFKLDEFYELMSTSWAPFCQELGTLVRSYVDSRQSGQSNAIRARHYTATNNTTGRPFTMYHTQ